MKLEENRFAKICLNILMACFCIFIMLFTPGGCVQKADTTVKTGTAEDTSSFENVAQRAVVTLYFPGIKKPDMDRVLKEIEKKSLPTINAELDFRWFPREDYNNSIIKACTSGSRFEGFYFSDSLELSPDNFNIKLDQLARSYTILDVTKLLPAFAPDLYKKYSTDELAACKVDGKLYAIPWCYPFSLRNCAVVREDLMRKYGLGSIKTYDDLEYFLQMVKDNDGQLVPLVLYNGSLKLFGEAGGYVIFDQTLGLVYRWDDPEMKLSTWEMTPEYEQGVGKLLQWQEKQYISTDKGILKNPEYSLLVNGKAAACIGDLNTAETINDELKGESANSFRFKSYPLYNEKTAQRISPLANSIVLNSNADCPERTVMFIQWIQQNQDNYDLLMYGIKGENYTLFGEQYNLPKGTSLSKSPYIKWDGYSAFLNISFDRSSVVNSPDYKKVMQENLNLYSKYAPHNGFIPDFDSVKTEYFSRKDAFSNHDRPSKNVVKSYGSIQAYLEKVRKGDAAAVDKIIYSLQSQLDKWRQKNCK